MYRRKFIAATTAVAVAGCVGSGKSSTPETAHRIGADSVQSESAPTAEVELAYGDWYEGSSTSVTVTGTSVKSELGTEASSDDALPPEMNLVIVSATLKNTTESQLALADGVSVSFAVVAGEQLFEPVATKQSSGDQSPVDVSQVAIDSATYLPEATARLDPGEQLAVWQAVLVPSSVTTAEMQITMCGGDAGCNVRWEPSAKTCDCPG